MKTLVIITTYNRHDYLAELLPHVLGPDRTVWVIDDGSVPRVEAKGAVVFHYPHHGRGAYHRLIDRTFDKARASAFDRFLMIPDDVMPWPDLHRFDVIPPRTPFSHMEDIWQEVKAADPHAICLNPLVDRRGHIQQWGSAFPVKVTPNAWLTGWNDLCFYGERSVFGLRSDPRFKPPTEGVHKGSAVGGQFSRRLRKHGNLYQVDQTIWLHRDGPSVMCPEERRENPL